MSSDRRDRKLHKVEGPRSPRWALWSRMTIPCQDGLLYLARLRIIQTPWFGIYLHDIYEPDGDRHPHNHPWSFISIILRGEYTEDYYSHPENMYFPGYVNTRSRTNTWKRFSIHRMNRQAAHHITHAAPGLKTLIITGPRRHSWGFFTEEGYVDWKVYKDKQGRSA